MLLEWDVRKSFINKHKHGISFEEVRILLGKHGFIDTFVNPSYPHQDLIVFRGLNGKIYRAVTENRNGVTRLISAHRSRKLEKQYGP